MDASMLCIGCLCSKNLQNVDTPVSELDNFGGDGDYGSLFFAVFNLEVHSHPKTRKICTECMEKLKSAALFKAQVVNSLDFIQESKVFFLETDDALDMDEIKTENSLDSNDEEEPLQKLKELMQSKPEISFSGVKVEFKKTRHRQKKSNVSLLKPRKPKVVIKWESGTGDTSFSYARKERKILKSTDRSRARNVPKCPEDYQYSEEDLTCPECGMLFESAYQLNRHRNSHNPAYMCEECGRGFRNKHSLTSHMDTHKEGPHICDICNRQFIALNSMRSHRRTHTSSMYVCKICGEQLRTYHSQRVHLQKVHGVKLNLYKCPHCEKTFITSTKRSSHIRSSHLKSRPHKCPQCELMFSAPAVLRSHLANAHGIGEKRYRCEFCDKRFTRLFTLKEHVRIHTKDFRFSCSLCEKRFIQKCSLKSHIKNNHTQKYVVDI